MQTIQITNSLHLRTADGYLTDRHGKRIVAASWDRARELVDAYEGTNPRADHRKARRAAAAAKRQVHA